MRFSVIAGIVVEKAVYRFDKPFDYSVPPELVESCKPGCRVTVPFGNGNAKRQGLVLYVSKGEVECDQRVKNILSVIDKTPVLSDEFLSLVKWLKANTFCTYYDAVKTVIPFGLNMKMVEVLTLNSAATPNDIASLSKQSNDIVLLGVQKYNVWNVLYYVLSRIRNVYFRIREDH